MPPTVPPSDYARGAPQGGAVLLPLQHKDDHHYSMIFSSFQNERNKINCSVLFYLLETCLNSLCSQLPSPTNNFSPALITAVAGQVREGHGPEFNNVRIPPSPASPRTAPQDPTLLDINIPNGGEPPAWCSLLLRARMDRTIFYKRDDE